MRDTAASSEITTSINRRGKHRAKSGCRTCKSRKVKCDEGRPACQRCVETGRVCDGYGIWGGGGNLYANRRQISSIPKDLMAKAVLFQPPAPISVLVADSEEKAYFDWFKDRTLQKFTGSFVSRFWKTLTLQASFREPAILHAVLALSSVHKRGVCVNLKESSSGTEQQRDFAIKHYIAAIKHLRPHFSTGDRGSLRIALITCLVFVAFELFRGHFTSAHTHLNSGLKVLEDSWSVRTPDHGTFDSHSKLESLDAWILEAFSRLQFQVELFHLSHQGQWMLRHHVLSINSDDTMFQSINEGWQQLQQLFSEIFVIANESTQAPSNSETAQRYYQMLFDQREQVRKRLQHWLCKYESRRRSLRGFMTAEESKGYKLLPAYHNMASIMVEACLNPNDESVYDSLTMQFAFLVGQMAELWVSYERLTSSTPLTPMHRPGDFVDMGQSYIDIGWCPLLHYAAIKCRVHRIRLQAIRLLECSSHREGFWDGEITACVARKVMELEEQDYYRGASLDDDFPLSSCPTPRDLQLKTIPDSYRLRGLEVVLSGEPVSTILLWGHRGWESDDKDSQKVLLSQYHVGIQRWL
ncbi:hypothetical protein BX600DRAFT_447335 [Xylariales sp. PMI_506]|nr:hypothetical protein BX600DRAFT_447335 [Xylariales sp. PMI_506]